MAPVQQVWDFPGIPDDLLSKLLPSSSATATPSSSSSSAANIYGKRSDSDGLLEARSGHVYQPGKGAVDPDHINMKGLYALFAILGVAFVLAGIWFFFWAKNGGFVWRKGDWEDYKSTVLRRKGPDGKTLSNATKSTKLGGGSVVGKGYSDWDGYTESGYGYTDTATAVTEKTNKKNEKKNKKKEERDAQRKTSGGTNFLREIARRKFMRRRADPEEPWNGEEYEDDDVKAYRQEKAARVGGINREAEGTYHGSDYDTSNPPTHYNDSEMSEVRDHAYPAAPPILPPPATASRHQSKRQSRNFSFTPGPDESISQVTPNDNNRRHRSTRNGNGNAGRGNSRTREQEREQRRAAREHDARRHNRRRERRRNPPPSTLLTGSESTSSVSQSQAQEQEQQRRNERNERIERRREQRRSLGHHVGASEVSSSTATRSDQQSSVVTDDENGNRSYHHPIPGLSKGYRRGGGGRKRRDSLSESD